MNPTTRVERVCSILVTCAIVACDSSQSLPEIDAALRGSQVRTVLVGDTATLFSPYAAPLSERYLAIAQREFAAVRAQLGTGELPQLRVLLVRAQSAGEAQLLEEVLPSIAGIGGFVGTEAEVVVVVPLNESSIAARDAETCVDVMRHEITHAAVRLLGLDLDKWLDEALATTLESRIRLEDGELVDDPLPDRIVQARFRHREIPLARMLDWDREGVANEDPRERELALYAHARAFLEFHRERVAAGTLRELVESLNAKSHLELRDDEVAYRVWLDRWDWEERLRTAFQHGSPRVRAAASFHLLEIAQGLGGDPFADRFDAEAIARVESDDGDFPCAEYLLTVRGANLATAACERLIGSTSPLARILGFAISKSNGLPIDQVAIRSAREQLSTMQRSIAARALFCLDGQPEHAGSSR